MNNVYEFSPVKTQYTEASSWVTKLDRGLSAKEHDELELWFAESDENRAILLSVAKKWDQLSELSRLADLFPDHSMRHRGRRHLVWGAAATCFVAVAAANFMFMPAEVSIVEQTAQTIAPETAVYETAVGEQSTVVLADGTRVILNTDSHLSVQYATFHRTLVLDRGELHVDVVPDKSRPLTVFAGDKMVQALGTSFGIEIRDDKQVEVVVTEGKVLIALRPESAIGAGSVQAQAPVLPATSLTVTRGEEARLSEYAQPFVREVTLEEISVRLAWRDGDLIFRGEPLGEAMADIGRYTTVEFVFLNDELKKEPIIGRFRSGDVDGLLAVLRENLGIAYERTEDGRVLLSSL